MAMTNMQMSAEEAREACGDDPKDGPKYPWGLCVDLSDESLAKLGITELPAVGAKLMLHATVEVTRTGAYQSQGSEREMNVGLQITDMELALPAGKSIADSLYGG